MSALRPSSHTDFQPLEEILVGSARGLNVPALDIALRHFFDLAYDHSSEFEDPRTVQRVIDETEEDFAGLCDTFAALGISVRRPVEIDHRREIKMLDWTSTSMHSLMPRDCLLVLGSTIIEVPMAARSRYCESFPLRGILRDYLTLGARWLAAPRPQLKDSTYRFTPEGPILAEEEPLFDAANIIRCGRDLFYNVSNSGNELGARWLENTLGSDYRVHRMTICSDHVGTTIQLLRPGVLLANAARLTPEMIPVQLRDWQILWFADPVDSGCAFRWPRASVWVGMNIISVDEERIIVPSDQITLMRLLESAGFTVIPVPFRHGRALGGGLHCCTLDTRRAGTLEAYV